MKITQVDLWHVSIPTPAPFYPSWIPGFPQTENRFTLLRLRTASGLEGWSAAPALGRERAGLGDLLGPYLLGERADDIVSIQQRIREMGYLGWRSGWIEPACWDIVGKARNAPVYKLLGGHGGRVKLYASTGEVKSGAQRIEEVQARMREGFEAVKLRVHDQRLEQDLAQIRETRHAVGHDVVLGVDCNQAWRVASLADAPTWDRPRALAFCQEAQALDFRWVEEPLAMDDYDGLAWLRSQVDIAISGGELNNQGLPEFQVMLEKGCYDWYQPDAVFTGGIAGTWRIIQRVAAAGMKYSPHTWTNGIGFAINLQLHAASPSREHTLLEYPYNPPSWMPEVRDGVLREPYLHERGWLNIPDKPGLGFEIDARKLRKYGQHFFRATALRVAVRTLLDKGVRSAREMGQARAARLARRHAELDALAAGGTDPALEAIRV
jgi:L-alanine-DL-glutamate epimerase-like enolase superfamily enzyme